MKWDFGQVTIRNAYVHDNDCRGLWADMNAHDTVIEYNLIEHNLAEGIFYEISQDAVIRYNQVYRNGYVANGWYWDAGINVNASFNVEVYGNRLSGNYNGITGVQQDRPDSTPPHTPARPLSRARQPDLRHRRRRAPDRRGGRQRREPRRPRHHLQPATRSSRPPASSSAPLTRLAPVPGPGGRDAPAGYRFESTTAAVSQRPQAVVGGQEHRRRVLPGEHRSHSSRPARPIRSRRAGSSSRSAMDCAISRWSFAGAYTAASPAGARLREIERHDRQAEEHVLHDLVHRALVGPRCLRIRVHRHVRGRQNAHRDRRRSRGP